MRYMLVAFMFIASVACAQDNYEYAFNTTPPWLHDSQYIVSLASDASTVSLSEPSKVDIQPNNMYSHLEMRVQRYDNNIFLTGQLIKHPETEFANALLLPRKRFYIITFKNGKHYTYNEQYVATYADKAVFALLKGTAGKKTKADPILLELLRKNAVASIQPYTSATTGKPAFIAGEKYTLTDEAAQQLMRDLQ